MLNQQEAELKVLMYLLSLPTLHACSTQHNFIVLYRQNSVPIALTQTEDPSCHLSHKGVLHRAHLQTSLISSQIQWNPRDFVSVAQCCAALDLHHEWQNMCMNMRSISLRTSFMSFRTTQRFISVKIFFKCPYKKNLNYCYSLLWNSLHNRREVAHGWTFVEVATEIS